MIGGEDGWVVTDAVGDGKGAGWGGGGETFEFVGEGCEGGFGEAGGDFVEGLAVGLGCGHCCCIDGLS